MTKVFNQSGRIYQHGEHAVHPLRFTELPDDVAEFLIKNYPSEIMTDDSSAANRKSVDKVLQEKDAKIALLEKQLANLQKVVTGEAPAGNIVVPAATSAPSLAPVSVKTRK